MPSAHPLEEIFLRATYHVRLPRGGRAAIRIGEPLPPALYALLPEDDAPWGFITACNPRGQTRPRRINRRAMHELREAFRECAPQACLHAGYGALGTWREPSLFACGHGVSFERLDELMQRFDQLAIVRGNGAQPSQLHWSPWLEHTGEAPNSVATECRSPTRMDTPGSR